MICGISGIFNHFTPIKKKERKMLVTSTSRTMILLSNQKQEYYWSYLIRVDFIWCSPIVLHSISVNGRGVVHLQELRCSS
jgi:hypothetical protein